MTYRERREARAERLRGWAEKREAKAQAASEAAHARADLIPFGQPILIGHHSEKRHRRDLDRIDRSQRAAVEHARKAESMNSRADNIEAAAERAIYDDDPDAIEQLTARIAELEAKRERIKKYNASCRTAKGKADGVGNLSLLDPSERAELASIARVCSYQLRENGAAPAYWSSNLSGNINRNKKRLARLEADRRAEQQEEARAMIAERDE